MSKKEKTCKHCGAPYRGDSEYCCLGCEYVHQLILDEGFDRYYELKDRNLPPVGSNAFRERDDNELVGKWQQSDPISPGVHEAEFELKGISCVGCVWLVEKLFSRYDNTVGIQINPHDGLITIQAGRDFDLAGFAAEIQRFGYTLREWTGVNSKGAGGSISGGKMGVCAFLAMNAMMFNLPFYLGMELSNELAPLLQFVVVILASFSVLVGGTFFFRRAIKSLQVGALHIDLPIALGILVAYIGSFVGWLSGDERLFYFDFISIFIVLMLLGRWLQERVTDRNVRQGYEANPSEQFVDLVDDSGVVSSKINVRDIESGIKYRAIASSWIPVQSRVEAGRMSVSLESINGEAEPHEMTVGDSVPAGAILLSRDESVELRATEGWSQSLLKRLFEIQSGGNRESSRMEMILKVYILTVIVMAVIGCGFWGMFLSDWKTGFQVAVSILVVSCPCAIGLAYPKVNDQCARWLRSRGVYVRLHSLWGRLTDVRNICFDKTGTLTLETLELLNQEVVERLDETQLRGLYGLVARNLHPIGRSLKEYLLAYEPSLAKVNQPYPEVEECVGFGVKMLLDGCEYFLGKSQDRPGTTEFKQNGELVVLFEFGDSVRNDAKDCIEWFEQRGKKVFVISGDSGERVSQLLGVLGLPEDRGIGGMSPGEKASWIERHAPDDAMMVGDGANDALAFEQAVCTATPVIGRGILETHADFFFLGKGIRGIKNVFELNRFRQQALFEILSMTVLYNAAAIVVSMMGFMNPLLAAILMPISSIVTVSWAAIRLASSRLNRELG